jgi:hypothetical protein
MTAVMILSEGWSYSEGARLMGVEYATFVTHITDAAERLPGDLPPRLRALAWWRGASSAVLGVRAAPATRSATLSEATTIYGGRCCPYCGRIIAHGTEPAGSGDVRPA